VQKKQEELNWARGLENVLKKKKKAHHTSGTSRATTMGRNRQTPHPLTVKEQGRQEEKVKTVNTSAAVDAKHATAMTETKTQAEKAAAAAKREAVAEMQRTMVKALHDKKIMTVRHSRELAAAFRFASQASTGKRAHNANTKKRQAETLLQILRAEASGGHPSKELKLGNTLITIRDSI